MIFGIAAVLILLMIFSGVAVPLAFLGGSFFVAYMGLGSTGTFATNAFYILNSISMLAIPLFIVGGSLIERSGIANVLIRVADQHWQRLIHCQQLWCQNWKRKDMIKHI